MLFFEQALKRGRRRQADLVEAMAAGAGVPWGTGKKVNAYVEALRKED